MAFYFCLVTFLSWHIENNEKRLTPKIYSVLEILDSFKVMIWNAHLIFAKIPPRFEVKIQPMWSFSLVSFWCKGMGFHAPGIHLISRWIQHQIFVNVTFSLTWLSMQVYTYYIPTPLIWIASIMNPIWSIQTMNPIHSSIKCYRDFKGT